MWVSYSYVQQWLGIDYLLRNYKDRGGCSTGTISDRWKIPFLFHCLLDTSKKRSCNLWVLYPDCLLGLKELRWGTPSPKLNVPLVSKEHASLRSLQICGQMSKLWPHYLALRKRAEGLKVQSLALRSSLSQGKQNPCETGGSLPVAARSSDELMCLKGLRSRLSAPKLAESPLL